MQNCKSERYRCESTELIKNGGFEIRSPEPGYPFQYWQEVNPDFARVANEPILTNIAYEGLSAARFDVLTTIEDKDKSVALRQTVVVTPGCIYRLSFAENLLSRGSGASVPLLTARVFYVDNFGNDVNLIIVPISKFSQLTLVGYTFHEETANVPVPCDVSELIVRFDFFVTNQEGTIWMLDGVSLRAVFPTSDCCGNNKRCV